MSQEFAHFQNPLSRVIEQSNFERQYHSEEDAIKAGKTKGKKAFMTSGKSAYLAMVLALVHSMQTASLTQDAAAGQLEVETKRTAELNEELKHLTGAADAIADNAHLTPEQRLAYLSDLQVKAQEVQNNLSVIGAKQQTVSQTLIDGTSTAQNVDHQEGTQWTDFVSTFAKAPRTK